MGFAFGHWPLRFRRGDAVEVSVTEQANVMLMDGTNFDAYRNRRPFRYTGGCPRYSPVRLVPPRPGAWHLCIDTGGRPSNARASVRMVHSPRVPIGRRDGNGQPEGIAVTLVLPFWLHSQLNNCALIDEKEIEVVVLEALMAKVAEPCS